MRPRVPGNGEYLFAVYLPKAVQKARQLHEPVLYYRADRLHVHLDELTLTTAMSTLERAAQDTTLDPLASPPDHRQHHRTVVVFPAGQWLSVHAVDELPVH